MANLFDTFVLNPENLGSIRDAVQETLFNDENFNQFVTLTRVKEGDPIAFIGELEMVGKKGSGCDPTYEEKGIANSLKRWELGDWQIPIKMCYESVKGTVAEYSLNTGTAIGDLTDTDIMTIYTQALARAMQQMIWRFGWFGDKTAKNVTGGGKITDGVATDLFTTCDGLFKRIFAICTAHEKQKTAIAANAKTTTADQKSAILTKGTATDLVDKILMDADSRIIDDPSAVLMMTRSLADALTYDIKKSYQINMPWERIFSGFDTANYNGVTIARVSIWDRLIAANEKGAATVNLPYRAVFCNPKQLLVGTPQDSLISDLDIWFSKKERRNYIYSTGKIGTAILEENLIHAAY